MSSQHRALAEGALEKLAEVVTAAVEDRRDKNALEELEG